MIRTSEQINEISEALVKAQAKFGAAIKSSQNPAFRSKYADLTSIIDATLEHLNSEGIVAMQHPMLEYKGEGDNREAMITVTTRLQHKAGQFIESDLSIPAIQRDRFDAQSCGSALTYASRYALQSILVVPREDDDANNASGVGTKEAAQAVGKEKIDKLKAKVAQNGSGYVPSLFYNLTDSGLYEISGDESLKTANKDILKQFWSASAKAIVVTDNQLEDLKFMLEERHVAFSGLKAS